MLTVNGFVIAWRGRNPVDPTMELPRTIVEPPMINGLANEADVELLIMVD